MNENEQLKERIEELEIAVSRLIFMVYTNQGIQKPKDLRQNNLFRNSSNNNGLGI